MLNVIGYVTKQADGRYKGHLRTLSIKAEIDILSNIRKTADTQLDFRVMTEANEFGVGWPAKATPRLREMCVCLSPLLSLDPRNSAPFSAKQ